MKRLISKRIICVMLAFGIIVSAEVFSPAAEKAVGENNSRIDDEFISQNRSEYEYVCSDGDIALWYRQDIGAYQIKNTDNIVLWNSVITDELYDLDEFGGKWLNYMQSVLAIRYTLNTDTSGNFMKSYSAAETTSIKSYRLEKGIRQVIEFKDSEITVTLDTILSDGGLTVMVPKDGIVEKGDFCLVSFEIMPFFGASTVNEDGYLVYPDGNGALTYFDTYNKRNINSTALTLDVYGTINTEEIDGNDNNYPASMPLFGIKKGERAFAAAVTSGDDAVSISVNPALDISPVELNYEYFSFSYRQTYKIYLSGIGSSESASSGTKLSDAIGGKRSVRYFFLSGNEANYSGMANVYRDFLLKNKLLNPVNDVEEPCVYLMLFMGAKNLNSLFGGVTNVTTFEEVQKIISDYREAGVKNLNVTLRGWNKGGYDSGSLKINPDRKCGGKAGFTKLIKFVNSCNGVKLFLELNFLELSSEKLSFGLKQSAVLLGNSTTLTDKEKEKYLLSPLRFETLYKKANKKISKFGNVEIAVCSVGELIYTDYRRSKTQSRKQTMDVFKQVSDTGVQGANLYMLSTAKYLYDVPFENSTDRITDEQIPLVSSVIGGSIPMTSGVGNMTADYDLLKLRWIEYGLCPSFELTYDSPIKLGETNYTVLFSSRSSKWEKTVADTYNIWVEKLSDIYGKKVISHEKIGEGVVRIVYENDAKVYLNYKMEDTEIDGITIKAKNFTVVKTEGTADDKK